MALNSMALRSTPPLRPRGGLSASFSEFKEDGDGSLLSRGSKLR